MNRSIDIEKCTLCGRCRMICPSGLFEQGKEKMQFVPRAEEFCLRCGHCIAACPEDAITIEGMDMELFPSLGNNLMGYEELQTMLLARRSIRHFIDKPVNKEAVDRILASVAAAPSGMGLGPPPICVINGRDKIEPMIPSIMEFYRGFRKGMKSSIGRMFMRLIMKKNEFIAMKTFMPMMDRMFEYYDSTGNDVITWGAPLLMIFHTPKTSISGDKDAMIACTYAMLAAHAQGLGTTIIGMVPPYIERNKDARMKLGIPPDNEVVISMIAGHPAMKFSRGILKKPEVTFL